LLSERLPQLMAGLHYEVNEDDDEEYTDESS